MTFDLVVDPSDARRREWAEERNLIAFSLHHPKKPMEEVDIASAPSRCQSVTPGSRA